MMHRVNFWSGLLILFLFSCTSEMPTRPNVILILTDDQGWGDLSLHEKEWNRKITGTYHLSEGLHQLSLICLSHMDASQLEIQKLEVRKL